VLLQRPYALKRQLWQLLPTGIAGEFAIVSTDNGLALDQNPPPPATNYSIAPGGETELIRQRIVSFEGPGLNA
jgi:hypothetical protein